MSQRVLEGSPEGLTRTGRSRDLDLAQVVERSALRSTPFDHIYMENVFPPAFYRDLLDNAPAAEKYHPLHHRDALRPDGTSTRQRLYLYPETLWRLPGAQRAVWGQVAKALTSSALELAFKRKFQSALENRFQVPVEQIPLYPVPILVRDLPGYHIRIHADTLTKAITVQFYLPRDKTQSHLGTVFHSNKQQDDSDVAMQFVPSSGYAFPVMRKESWHSAPQTTEADGERQSIMLTYYVDERSENRRKRRMQRLGIFFGVYPRY